MVLRKQVETLQPDVTFCWGPGIHDFIQSKQTTDPVQLANQFGELAVTLKKSSPTTRLIFLSINAQDESKKLQQYANQGRDWSVRFIRTVAETLKGVGVEVLYASSFTHMRTHGNVLSADGRGTGRTCGGLQM